MPVEDEPTRSQQTNRLIALCHQVESGRGGEEELGAYLAQRRTGLRIAREDFLSRARGEGEDSVDALGEATEAVLEHFDLHARALDEAAAFFEDGDGVHLREGAEALAEVTPALLQALENYEAGYMVVGPTPYPMVNILEKVIPTAVAGRLSGSQLEALLGGAVETFEKAVAEIDAFGVEKQVGLSRRRGAFLQVIEGARRMQRFLEDGNREHLEQGLEVIRTAHDAVEESYAVFREERFTGQPTASPMANWVIHAAEGVPTGQYPPAILAQAIDWLEGEVGKIRENFEETAASPTASVMILEELPRTMEAFDLYEEALQVLRAGLEPSGADQVVEGVRLLKEAVARLRESQQVYEQADEQEGKVLCPQCHEPNYPGNRACAGCGATLPRVMDVRYTMGAHSTFETLEAGGAPPADQDLVMTTHLKRIFDAAEAVHGGSITVEEFLDVLDWGEGLLQDGERQFEELPCLEIPLDLAEEEREAFLEQKALADQARDLLRRGIDEFRDGLDQMRHFAEHPDQDTLVAGIRTVWEASRKLNQCQRMAEAVERLEAAEAQGDPGEPTS